MHSQGDLSFSLSHLSNLLNLLFAFVKAFSNEADAVFMLQNTRSQAFLFLFFMQMHVQSVVFGLHYYGQVVTMLSNIWIFTINQVQQQTMSFFFFFFCTNSAAAGGLL